MSTTISKYRGKSATTAINQLNDENNINAKLLVVTTITTATTPTTITTSLALTKSYVPQTSLLKIEPFVPSFTTISSTSSSSSSSQSTKFRRPLIHRSYSTLSSTAYYKRLILDQNTAHYPLYTHSHGNHSHQNRPHQNHNRFGVGGGGGGGGHNKIVVDGKNHSNNNFIVRKRSKSSLSSSTTTTTNTCTNYGTNLLYNHTNNSINTNNNNSSNNNNKNSNNENYNNNGNNIIGNSEMDGISCMGGNSGICRINRTAKEQERLPDRINYDRRGLTSIPVFENENNLRLLSLQHNLINVFHIPSTTPTLSSLSQDKVGSKQNNEKNKETQEDYIQQQDTIALLNVDDAIKSIGTTTTASITTTTTTLSFTTQQHFTSPSTSSKRILAQNPITTQSISSATMSTKQNFLPSSGTNINSINFNNTNNNNNNNNNHYNISNNNNFIEKSIILHANTSNTNISNNNNNNSISSNQIMINRYALRRTKSFITSYSKHFNTKNSNLKNYHHQKYAILTKTKNMKSFESSATNGTASSSTSEIIMANGIQINNKSNMINNNNNSKNNNNNNNFEYLKVKNNQLIPFYGNTFENLVFLDLYNNQIEKISNLDGLKSITVLLLGKNRITDITGLISIKNTLRVLDLHGNKIINLNNKINCLRELKSLNLASNQIRQINQNDFTGLINLKELNLKRNKIKRVSGFNNLVNLERLWLCHNDLHKIDDMSTVSKAINLQEVTIENNPVSLAGDCVSFLVSYLPKLIMLSQMPITEQVRKAAMAWRKSKEISENSTHSSNLSPDAFNNIRREEIISNARTNWELLRSQQMILSSTNSTNVIPIPSNQKLCNFNNTQAHTFSNISNNIQQQLLQSQDNELLISSTVNDERITTLDQENKYEENNKIPITPQIDSSQKLINNNESHHHYQDNFHLPPILQSSAMSVTPLLPSQSITSLTYANLNSTLSEKNSSGSSLGPNIDSSSSCFSSSSDDTDDNKDNGLHNHTVSETTKTIVENKNEGIKENENDCKINEKDSILMPLNISQINEQPQFECEDIFYDIITKTDDFKEVVVIDESTIHQSTIFPLTNNTDNNNFLDDLKNNNSSTVVSLFYNKNDQNTTIQNKPTNDLNNETTTATITSTHHQIQTIPSSSASLSTIYKVPSITTINFSSSSNEYYNTQSDKTTSSISMTSFKSSESEISSSLVNNMNNTLVPSVAITTNLILNPSMEKSTSILSSSLNTQNVKNNSNSTNRVGSHNNVSSKRYTNSSLIRSQTARPRLSSTSSVNHQHHHNGTGTAATTQITAMSNSNNNNTISNGHNFMGQTIMQPKVNKQPIEREREQGGDYLIEICGRYLNIYGLGALRFIDKQWNTQKANDVHTLNFSYINFNSIATILCRIKLRFQNSENFVFRETNINSLGQLNALSELQGITTLVIDPEGNFICNKINGVPTTLMGGNGDGGPGITNKSIIKSSNNNNNFNTNHNNNNSGINHICNWRLYAIYRLSHWGLKTINGIDINDKEIEQAHYEYSGLTDLVLWYMPETMLQPLLQRLRLDETCTASKLSSAKEWLMKADQSLKNVVSKEALQWKKITMLTTTTTTAAMMTATMTNSSTSASSTSTSSQISSGIPATSFTTTTTSTSQDQYNLRERGKLHLSVMIENTCNAVEKLQKLETLWPSLLLDIVRNTLIDYSQLDVYLKNLMAEVTK